MVFIFWAIYFLIIVIWLLNYLKLTWVLNFQFVFLIKVDATAKLNIRLEIFDLFLMLCYVSNWTGFDDIFNSWIFIIKVIFNFLLIMIELCFKKLKSSNFPRGFYLLKLTRNWNFKRKFIIIDFSLNFIIYANYNFETNLPENFPEV